MRSTFVSNSTDCLPVAILAESDEENRMLIKSLLELLGFAVVSSNGEQEAYDFASFYQPELILIELKIPVRTSFSTIRRIRKIANLGTTPIIAMSPATDWDSQLALAAGCSAYITKPIELDQLEKIVESLIPCNRLSLVSLLVH